MNTVSQRNSSLEVAVAPAIRVRNGPTDNGGRFGEPLTIRSNAAECAAVGTVQQSEGEGAPNTPCKTARRPDPRSDAQSCGFTRIYWLHCN
jgi:hypothetical protein